MAYRLLVTVVLLATVPLSASPARGQPDDQQAGNDAGEDGPDLLITELTGVVRPGGRLEVAGEVRNPGGESLEGARLVATLLRPSSNRLDLHRALDDPERAPARRVVGRLETDVQPIPAGDRAPLRLSVPITELGLGSLPDSAAGVYPLQLDLQRGGALLDHVVTSLIAMPEQLGEPLRTAIVAPLDSPMGLSADGSVVNDPLAGDLGRDGNLPGLAGAMARAPEVPLTLATSGTVLNAAEEAADGYTATDAAGAVVVSEEDPESRRAAGLIDDIDEVLARPEVEHIALPFASADLVALVRNGQLDAARQAMAQGAVSSAAATGDRPVPGVLLPPDHLDEATLDVLAAGVDTMLLDARNLGQEEQPNPAGLTPSPVRRLPISGGSTLNALVADAWLSALFGGDFPPENSEVSASTPALAAQRVLAETAAVYFERPFNQEARGLLLTPPIPWELPADTLVALLEGLDEAPWLQPVTAPDLAEQVPTAEEPVTLAYPQEAQARELDAAYLAAVEEGREAIASLATILAAAEEPEDADRVLRIATSIHYRGERRDQGLRLIDTVQAAANSVFDGVAVVPGPQFTLTSRSGDVPVTLTNESGVAVRVFVRVESPRFAFAQDTQEATLAPGEQVPVVFRTEALTPGATAPIEVTVTDAQDRVLTTGRVVVATRADSVTALVVTIGAGLFLAGWWLRDVRRRRTERREVKVPA